MDCTVIDPDMLEFNHIRDKELDLSFMVQRGYSIKRLEAEKAKGFVLCANHHRKWTVLSYKVKAEGLKQFLEPSVSF
jgi:stage III sporulation protein SpoIIIAA